MILGGGMKGKVRGGWRSKARNEGGWERIDGKVKAKKPKRNGKEQSRKSDKRSCVSIDPLKPSCIIRGKYGERKKKPES